MNCEEVKISLHNFFDGLLDDFTKRNVELHLRGCEKCYSEYKKLKVFFDLIKEFPSFNEPPADIISKFSYELMRKSRKTTTQDESAPPADTRRLRKELKKQEKKIKKNISDTRISRASQVMALGYKKSSAGRSSFNWAKSVLSFIPIILIAAGYFIYDYQKYNSPWEIKNIRGEILINGSTNHAYNFSQGESLISQYMSSAIIRIPKVCDVFVDDNTSLYLEKAKDGGNRLNLNYGRIKVTNTVDLPDFVITCKGYEINDKSGEFTVVASDTSGALISVNRGFIEIICNEQSTFLNERYVCNIKVGFGTGTPYNIDASDSLKEEIKSFDYNNGGDAAVDKIIAHTGPKDVLTLLALIPRASQLKRQQLYQEITNQFPPPENVTRMGIIKADPQMLFLWWQEIQWQL